MVSRGPMARILTSPARSRRRLRAGRAPTARRETSRASKPRARTSTVPRGRGSTHQVRDRAGRAGSKGPTTPTRPAAPGPLPAAGSDPVAVTGPASYLQGAPVGFGEAVKGALGNILPLRGRASRSAFWWFALLYVVAYLI